jgi:hypothetical protein
MIHRIPTAALFAVLAGFALLPVRSRAQEEPVEGSGVAIAEEPPSAAVPEGGSEGSETEAPAGAGEATEADAPAESEDLPEEEAPEAEDELGADVPTCRRNGARGQVTGDGEPLPEAPVEVYAEQDGRNVRVRNTLTDLDGYYVANLPPGVYTIRTRFDGYITQTQEVEVARRQCERLDFALETDELTEVEVEFEAASGSIAQVLTERRQAATVQDGISAEEISQSQDGDAAAATQRVVGATVVDRYLFVRGLGGRYTSVLLNGAYIPSSDPDYPGIELDLFPSGVLNSLNIVKTFNPAMPGDAAGGTLLIDTRSFPEELEASISLSFGVNSMSTFQSTLARPGGGLDWLGFDDGSRSLPSLIQSDELLGRPLRSRFESDEAFQQAQDDFFGTARQFRQGYQLEDAVGPPLVSLSASLGNSGDIAGRRLGYFVTVGYGLDTQILRGEQLNTTQVETEGVGDEQRLVDVDPLVLRERDSYSQEVQWGALGTVGLEVAPDNDLSLTLFWTQTAESYFGRFEANDISASGQGFIDESRDFFIQRNLFFGQLRGEHRDLPGEATLDWNLNGAIGALTRPDIRDVLYATPDPDSVPFRLQSFPGQNRRLFMNLEQREISGGSNLSIPVVEDVFQVSTGGLFRTREIDLGLRRFDLGNARRFDSRAIDTSLPPEELLIDDNFGIEGFQYEETTQSTDGYNGFQGLAAGYAAMDVHVTDWLRFSGGLRLEVFRQSLLPLLPTESFDDAFQQSIDQGASDLTDRTDIDPLGNLVAVIQPIEDMYIRLGWGSTVARPLLREIAPLAFPDFIRSRLVLGNPELRRSRIENFDVRWEYFPSPLEVVAVSFFIKTFNDPIEQVAFSNSQFTFRNAASALNFGGELEARINLGTIFEPLEMFDFLGNLTLVYSEVTLDEETRANVSSLQRPLAGQSPYVVNLSLGFRPVEGVELRLLYNVFGERIIDVGLNFQPDYYQQPYHSMNFVFRWQFHPNFTLSGRVTNIFYDDYLLTQTTPDGEVLVIQQFNEGLTGVLGIRWTPE